MNRNGLRVFIIEEHHEAYFIWKYALSKGLIRSGNQTLLHIDEHSDMGTPFLHRPTSSLNGNLGEIQDYVYQELGIATFIIPAIYDGLLNSVYWIKQRHNKTNKRSHKMYTRSQDSSGLFLATGKTTLLDQYDDQRHTKSKDAKFYKFYKQHIADLEQMDEVLMDIDLDYFSCIQNPLKEELKVEITKEEYDRFCSTPYHRIRFYDFGRVDALVENDRFYFCFNRLHDPRESPLKVSFERIQQRIDDVMDILHSRVSNPQLLTICRSRISGYTPHDQWEFIENKLLDSLSTVYGVESCTHINNL